MLFSLLVLHDKRSIEPRILFRGAQIPIQTYSDPQQRPGAGRRPECCPPYPDPRSPQTRHYKGAQIPIQCLGTFIVSGLGVVGIWAWSGSIPGA